MNPSNPTNNQPFIYRIFDSLGIAHLVAPVDHTHSQSEVSGLTSALNGKQNTLTFDSAPTADSNNPVTSGGIKTALDTKQNTLTFDNTPTASSTNPVTSGGVKAAIDKLPHWVVISNEIVLGDGTNRYDDHTFVNVSIDMVYPGAQLRLRRVRGNTTYSGPYYGSVVELFSQPDRIRTTMSNFSQMSGTIYELAVLQ